MPEFKEIAAMEGVFFVKLHNCMLGGRRLKATGIPTNIEELIALGAFVCREHNGVCDRTGMEHLPWDPHVSADSSAISYQTEAEAEYPQMMCEHIAKHMGVCVERANAADSVDFDFSEVFSGPLFPLTKAVRAMQYSVKRVALVSRYAREQAVQSAQPRLQRVGT